MGRLAGGPFPTIEELKTLYTMEFRVIVPLEKRNDIAEIEDIGFQVHAIYVEDFTSPTIHQFEEFK